MVESPSFLCPVFAVPVVIPGFLVLIVAAFVRRTVTPFVVAVMTAGCVRLLGGVCIANTGTERIRDSSRITMVRMAFIDVLRPGLGG